MKTRLKEASTKNIEKIVTKQKHAEIGTIRKALRFPDHVKFQRVLKPHLFKKTPRNTFQLKKKNNKTEACTHKLSSQT